MSEELKPCPFCGGGDLVVAKTSDEIEREVLCAECESACAPSPRTWNSRPIEDALRARVNKLEKVAEMAADYRSYENELWRLTRIASPQWEAMVQRTIEAVNARRTFLDAALADLKEEK